MQRILGSGKLRPLFLLAISHSLCGNTAIVLSQCPMSFLSHTVLNKKTFACWPLVDGSVQKKSADKAVALFFYSKMRYFCHWLTFFGGSSRSCEQKWTVESSNLLPLCEPWYRHRISSHTDRAQLESGSNTSHNTLASVRTLRLLYSGKSSLP